MALLDNGQDLDECASVAVKPLLDALEKQLIALSVGTCTCNVKSPDIQWHDARCTYRMAVEASETVDALRSALATPVSPAPDATAEKD